METSPLATESFSYSWLSSSSSDINFDIKTLKSKLSEEETINFDFDVPIFSKGTSTFSIVPADELFSDGVIRTVIIEPSSKVSVASSGNSKTVSSSSGNCFHCHIMRRWSRVSRVMFKKCVGYFRPVYRKIRFSRKSIQVDDIDHRRSREAKKSWNNSAQASPQRSPWSDHLDTSIHEAVLHCKRSLGK